MKYSKINLGYYRETPVFTSEEVQNGHILLLGASGGGKSVEAQRIIAGLLQQGATVLVISRHGTFANDQILPYYREILDVYRQDIWAMRNGINLPLFESLIYPNGSIEREEDTINAITNIFASAFGLGSCQKRTLQTAIETVMENDDYNSEGIKSIGTILGNGISTKAANNLYEKISSVLERNTFVNDGEAFLKENRLNVLHLEDGALGYQDTICEFVLSYLWRLANADQFKEKPLVIFLDEIQNMNGSKQGALAQMISEGRRMGISLILVTQSPFEKSNSVMQRITQAGLILFFKPPMGETERFAKMIAPADPTTWSMKLRGLKKGEFAVTGELKYGDRNISYPLVVTANVDKIEKLDQQQKFFHQNTQNGIDDRFKNK